MVEDAVLAEVWRRLRNEAAAARDALRKPPPAPSSYLEDAANRLQRSLGIVAEHERHKHRLVVLAELWCHFSGGDPNELVTSLLADESPD